MRFLSCWEAELSKLVRQTVRLAGGLLRLDGQIQTISGDWPIPSEQIREILGFGLFSFFSGVAGFGDLFADVKQEGRANELFIRQQARPVVFVDFTQ